MPVAFRTSVRSARIDSRRLCRTAQRLLTAAGHSKSVLSISLVGDTAMRALNRKYRGKDRPTDVLSFPLGDEILGDVVISVDSARRQAASYGASLIREIERLLIHGILHLLGHDHHRHDERVRMEREERRLARAIGMPWPYDKAGAKE